MTKKEATNCLSNGHAFWKVNHAKKICKTLGLKLPESLIEHYQGQADANPDNHPKGLWLNEDKAVSGVTGFILSNWIATQFKLKVPSFHGRGSQAGANSEAIAKHLA